MEASTANRDGLTVSVAMATYNGESYLAQQLESLKAQIQLPMELVVTDDGSSDRTIEILEAFAGQSPFPVKIIRNQTRLGFAENFLKAASLCSGALIAFADQDDVWMKDKIRICRDEFDRPEIVLAIHSSRVWFGGNQFGAVHHPFAERSRLSPICADPFDTRPGFSMVIRRQLLAYSPPAGRPKSSWRDEQKAHDEWCWFLAAFFGEIVQIPDILAWYRQHQKNVAGAPKQKSFWRLLVNQLMREPYAQTVTNVLSAHHAVATASGAGVSAERKRLAADYLKRRVVLLNLRAQIYEPHSSLKDRVSGFAGILRQAGYFGARRGSAWNRKTMAKDLFYGVTGFYRLKSVDPGLAKIS
jgi:glycosyltransferase involved in cell wall biosynthesis